jgi:hypothetical protein
VLDLSECKEIDDDCVEIITKQLTRLKTLKLNHCDKISEKSIETISVNCDEMRVGAGIEWILPLNYEKNEEENFI